MDCSQPEFSVPGISQARIVKWVARPSSRRSSWPHASSEALSMYNRWYLLLHKWLLFQQVIKGYAIVQNHLASGASQVAQWVKNLLEMRRCRFNFLLRKIPWRMAQQPTPVFLPGESHGQKSLVGYSPWSWKKSYITEVTELIYTRMYCSQWVKDCCWTAVVLAVASASLLNFRERFPITCSWHLLWPKGERLCQWSQTQSQVCLWVVFVWFCGSGLER